MKWSCAFFVLVSLVGGSILSYQSRAAASDAYDPSRNGPQLSAERLGSAGTQMYLVQTDPSPAPEDDGTELPSMKRRREASPPIAPVPEDDGTELPSRSGPPKPTGNAVDESQRGAVAKNIASPFNPTNEHVVYYPMVAFGPAKAKDKLIVIWDASQKSADAFNKLVIPLITRARGHKDRLLVAIQDLPTSRSAHRPDLLFFCATNPRQYASIFLRYMSDKSDKDRMHSLEGVNDFSINDAMEVALAKEHVKAQDCLKDQQLYQRGVVAATFTAGIKDKFHIQDTPALVWRDQVMPVNQKTIRQIKRIWR